MKLTEPSCLIAGYIVGMMCAFAAIFIMEKGQPALLYLVACTLCPVLLLALIRGHFRSIWNAYVPEANMRRMVCYGYTIETNQASFNLLKLASENKF